jgi:small ligand-binding sensory domain FIST
MKCVSVLSTDGNTETAAASVVGRAAEGLAGALADLALVFTSMHHVDALGSIARELRQRGLARHVLGCTGESIIGEDQEVEGEAALSLWAIQLPGATLTPRRLTFDQRGLQGYEPRAVAEGQPKPALLLLGDPFSFPPDPFLKRVNTLSPGVLVVGGMASASQAPGGNRLVLDDESFDDGAVAVELSGPVRLRTVVSQGCRPIGRAMIVTRAEGNVIRELGRRPALEVLREVFDELDADDQHRVQQGLHIGRVINEYQETFQRGDFLVRNVIGADDAGGIAVTDVIKVGQTVQFQVRDADSADEDLKTLLENERLARPSAQLRGALLFSCNGRGTRLFPNPNHDVAMLHQLLGPVPVAGFFAMGELGPVGGQNFVHGYTASIVVFEEAEDHGN